LVSATTIVAGLIFILGGTLKLGAVSELISEPVLKGFVFGLGVTIMVRQARMCSQLRHCPPAMR
jgi:MFS superfamily sulfate permease-like transporter